MRREKSCGAVIARLPEKEAFAALTFAQDRGVLEEAAAFLEGGKKD